MDHKSDNLPHFTLWAFLQQLRLHISRRSVIYLLLPMYPNEVPFMAATCSPIFHHATYLNLCADMWRNSPRNSTLSNVLEIIITSHDPVIQGQWSWLTTAFMPDSEPSIRSRPFACITTTTSRARWRHTWLFKCGTRLFAWITNTTSRAGLRHS